MIISEPSNPWMPGVSSLFRSEYYRHARARLKPSGYFCQWIQFYEISEETLHVMLNTLASEFPHVLVFFINSDLVCVASEEAITGDFDRFRARIPVTVTAGFRTGCVARRSRVKYPVPRSPEPGRSPAEPPAPPLLMQTLAGAAEEEARAAACGLAETTLESSCDCGTIVVQSKRLWCQGKPGMRLRSLPKWARKFAEEYVESEASWYLTKGELLSRRTLKKLQAQLRVLNTFRGKVWKDCQVKYARELERGRLYTARKTHGSLEDYTARVRVLKVCFESLGLAWTDDENGTVALTSVGKSFLRSRRLAKLEEVAARQVCKWQLVDPSLHTEAYEDLRVFPYYATLAVLAALPDCSLTREEFVLFVMRMSSGDERSITKTVSRIKRFRGLPQAQRKALGKALASEPLHGSKAHKPTSLLLRIERVASYLLPFLALGAHVELDRQHCIRIGTGFRNRAAEAANQHLQEETWIHFPTRKEWLSFYGDERARPTFHTALELYRDRSDTQRARETVKLAQAKGQAPEIGAEWIDAVAREEVLEVYLNAAPHHLEEGLRIAEVGGHHGRQFPTRVGPCDLLAVDSNGAHVVIELKKGRPANKVVGQLVGYVGALRDEYRWRRIRGFIVTTEADRRLRTAFREEIREPGRRKWRLYGADIKARFWQVEPASA